MYNPYIIIHVKLENYFEENQFSFNDENKYYLVFWWNSIPLGEMYYEPEERLSLANLEERILKAITPAIDFYLKEQEFSVYTYKEAFLCRDKNKFTDVLNDAFHNALSIKLPQKVDLSVIICTRNRSEQLKKCLNSIQNLQWPPAEIIVVDNAPFDNSTEETVKKYNNVTYYKEIRPGLDIARNSGAFKASCSLIAYTDDDVIVHPLWVKRIWETFLNKDIAAATGLVISSSLDTEAQCIFEKHWGFNKGYLSQIYNYDFLKRYRGKAPPVWKIGAGANMAFRKSVINEIGYFDERLDVGAAGCNGDSEIWYRILAKGYNIQYDPLSVVFHEHRKDLQALKKQLFSYMRGHVAAALIQYSQNKKAGYLKYVFWHLPKYYVLLLKSGFPNYSFRYQTLASEIRGFFSGISFFFKNGNEQS